MKGPQAEVAESRQSRASDIRRGGRRPDLLLERALDEFLYHHQQVSSSRTVAAYAGHLGVFYTWLSEYLGRTPLLSDLTLEIVDIWSRNLSQRPRRLAAGLVEGDGPIAWETRRTYLSTLRTFSNWLPRPPHCFCAEPPLKHLLLPRASDAYKMPLSKQELARLVAATREDSIRGAWDTALLLALIDGGLQAMEVARLRIGDATIESGLPLISHGRGNRSRVVTLMIDATTGAADTCLRIASTTRSRCVIASS